MVGQHSESLAPSTVGCTAGHCCTLDAERVARIAAARIPVELCLTSNVLTASVPTMEEHHWVQFTAAGVRVALCTDDSGVFNTCLSREFALAAEAFHLSDRALLQLAEAASQHIFEPAPEVKAALREAFVSFRSRAGVRVRAAEAMGCEPCLSPSLPLPLAVRRRVWWAHMGGGKGLAFKQPT